MNNLSDLSKIICDELRNNSGIYDACFITKYPGVFKSTPLTKTVISVGISQVDIEDSQIGEANNKKATVQMEILVCVPLRSKSLEGVDIMQTLFNYLWFDSNFNVKKCSCGSISANRTTGAYELCGTVSIETNITRTVS